MGGPPGHTQTSSGVIKTATNTLKSCESVDQSHLGHPELHVLSRCLQTRDCSLSCLWLVDI